MNKIFFFSFLALIILLLGATFVYQNRRASEPEPPAGPIQKESTVEPSILGKEYVVELRAEGYYPKEIIVRKGDWVKFVNKRDDPFWPASDLHPIHTIYPEFDPRQPMESNWSFRFDKVGGWRYHDHLTPIFAGRVEVIE